MVQQLSTNTFCTPKWIVNSDPTKGTHTTIAAAITSAVSGDTIWLSDGNYTENLTMKAGVNLFSSSFVSASITGTLTCTYSGTCIVNGILLATNSANIISMSGANNCVLYLSNCFFSITNSNGISLANSNSDSGIIAANCLSAVNPTFNLFAVSNANTLRLENCPLSTGIAGGTDSAVANTISAGSVEMRNVVIHNPITVSSTGTLRISNSIVDGSGTNTTALTVNGSGTSVSLNNQYLGGTASAVSVGTGARLNSYQDTFDSTNTNAVTGAGTISYYEPVFSNTSSKINTTTQMGGVYKGVQTNATVPSGFIGELLSTNVPSGSAVTLTSTVANNITNVVLTPGNWLVFGLVVINTSVSLTYYAAGINATTSTFTTVGIDYTQGVVTFGTTANTFLTPFQMISVAANTTYFLNVLCTFTGTATAFGKIQALRIA